MRASGKNHDPQLLGVGKKCGHFGSSVEKHWALIDLVVDGGKNSGPTVYTSKKIKYSSWSYRWHRSFMREGGRIQENASRSSAIRVMTENYFSIGYVKKEGKNVVSDELLVVTMNLSEKEIR